MRIRSLVAFVLALTSSSLADAERARRDWFMTSGVVLPADGVVYQLGPRPSQITGVEVSVVTPVAGTGRQLVHAVRYRGATSPVFIHVPRDGARTRYDVSPSWQPPATLPRVVRIERGHEHRICALNERDVPVGHAHRYDSIAIHID